LDGRCRAAASSPPRSLPSPCPSWRSRPAPRPILFTNFRLFDGTSLTLRDGLRLLVEGNQIRSLATGNPAPPEAPR
jgi:hypothetical protein